jgi:arsenical pump membrane protein
VRRHVREQRCRDARRPFPAHPRALLLGLDLGPNLAVTGSLSALLWLQVAWANGARPSVLRYSLLGSLLTPLSLVLGLLAAVRF